MNPLVSIIIPAYNAQAWISGTVQSALAQTWPEKEIIIVDDGSTDRTLERANRFQSGNVKVIGQENRGASSARNTGYRHCQGQLIQWLDADDILAPDKIENQVVSSLEEGGRREIMTSPFGTFYRNISKARFTPTGLWKDLEPVDWIITKMGSNCWMYPGAWLVPREIVETAGLWDENLSFDDDGEFYSRAVSYSRHVKFVEGAKSYYRIGNVGSLSKSKDYKACESLLLSLGSTIKRLLEMEDSERTRQAGINALNTWFHYFYPEKTDLLIQVKEIADALGKDLVPQDFGWKYEPVRKLFGYRAAKNAHFKYNEIKTSVMAGLYKMLGY